MSRNLAHAQEAVDECLDLVPANLFMLKWDYWAHMHIVGARSDDEQDRVALRIASLLVDDNKVLSAIREWIKKEDQITPETSKKTSIPLAKKEIITTTELFKNTLRNNISGSSIIVQDPIIGTNSAFGTGLSTVSYLKRGLPTKQVTGSLFVQGPFGKKRLIMTICHDGPGKSTLAAVITAFTGNFGSGCSSVDVLNLSLIRKAWDSQGNPSNLAGNFRDYIKFSDVELTKRDSLDKTVATDPKLYDCIYKKSNLPQSMPAQPPLVPSPLK